MLRHLLVISMLAAALYVFAADAADAADPTAQAFVDTVALGSVAVAETRPLVRRNLEALELDRCLKLTAEAPNHAQRSIGDVALGGMVAAMFTPTIPAMRAIVTGLDAIPTSDPVLRSGRAAWRASVELMARLTPLDRPCRRLEAWKRKGWKRGAHPRVLSPAFVAAMARIDDSPEIDRKTEAAERRLRQLGISRRDAEMWTGETAFGPIEEELDAVFERIAPDDTSSDLFDEPL